ncbi:hydroxyacylglutathione hydrolase [Caldimonas thermodepolymerans]|uniref:Hydroxyacylglutathione hydrolase n=1 Tax=Caldimonas thermodepolymerans TaxID=215580 RepID=A0A2S5T0G7_9BURK|nr:hydroxyacylglutathione hydrolase [Caldimonas thermodepolymerans]PPE68378.1 hydroxyacylglutathione hydrolase [Caldimonas thermodepolymerans]QPC30162.1 hydroxyacylglutathione hydrolase [Caldimonas thermodepolymerans]RDI00543.1 hydroxyacylglutathione hydrolase [Caldimonas thermodepolymerans]
MKLVALPAFTDNYVWMIHDGLQALVVDPGEATPVTDALQAGGLRLTGILVTHHHGDHVGGLQQLLDVLDGPVYGPAHESMPVPCTPVSEGDEARWNGLRFQVLDVPGHTGGHVAYWCEDLDGAPVLFCGDTLFSAGCGRLFEGTPAQMHASLGKLAALPADTRVCCAHEYTLSNLRFAQAAEPGNAQIAAHLAHCEALRARGEPTLPSSIGLERQINPFLRCDQPAVAATLRARGTPADDPVAVLAALRQWKNEFR